MFARQFYSLLAALILWPSFSTAQSVSSVADQSQKLNLTVYNSGRALITDARTVTMPKGTIDLKFMDVASQIMANTVEVTPLSRAGDVTVLEQNYEYDLLSPEKMLEKYVGQEVTLAFSKTKDQNSVEEQKKATLLSASQGGVWRIGESIAINIGAPMMLFPKIPENLIAKPTLSLTLNNQNSSPQQLQISYLTEGIRWAADYVVGLDADEKHAQLQGWVTLNNQSGATYSNARLQLIAGDIHQAPQPVQMKALRAAAMAMEERAEPGFAEKSFFEYHLYTLQRPTTVKDNQQKQVSLLQAAQIPVEKIYQLKGQPWYYMQGYNKEKQNVEVSLRMKNSEASHLGIPLPKGTVRIFKKDTDGSQQFIGEDAIDHTPRDEEVSLTVGNAFDIVAERTQKDYRTIGPTTHESEFEISLRNRKEEDVTVAVVEPIGGDWEMLKNSVPFKKTAAFAAEFQVAVPKRSETVLTYRVRSRY